MQNKDREHVSFMVKVKSGVKNSLTESGLEESVVRPSDSRNSEIRSCEMLRFVFVLICNFAATLLA